MLLKSDSSKEVKTVQNETPTSNASKDEIIIEKPIYVTLKNIPQAKYLSQKFNIVTNEKNMEAEFDFKQHKNQISFKSSEFSSHKYDCFQTRSLKWPVAISIQFAHNYLLEQGKGRKKARTQAMIKPYPKNVRRATCT